MRLSIEASDTRNEDFGHIDTVDQLATALRAIVRNAERRIGRKIGRAQLARSLHVSPQSLYAYLNGTTLPSDAVLRDLLDTLDAPADWTRALADARDLVEERRRRGRQPAAAAAGEITGDVRDECAPTSGRTSAPAGAHPATGTTPVPEELPPDVRAFTGRTEQLAAIDALLDDPTADTGGRPQTMVISVITGTGGVGKTALAVHWAHRVRDRFADGQLYVDLHGFSPEQPVTPTDALSGFLRSLGVSGTDTPLTCAEQSARFRSLVSKRRMLIILDNARDAGQVRPLLPGTSSCVVLVTSRDSLAGLVAREGVRRIALDILPLPDATALLRALVDGQAPMQPRATEDLANCGGRLPLALRIAAELATCHRWSLSALVDRLTDEGRRLDMLDAGGDSDCAVRAVLSWSYRCLSAATARTFRLLGLLPGVDFDAAAVAALTGFTPLDAIRSLETLTRLHLVRPTGVATAGTDRFAMHDLLRLYASELTAKLDPADERSAALSRYLGYHLHGVDAAAKLLFPHRPRLPLPPTGSDATPGFTAPGFSEPAEATAWLDAQRPVLVAAVSTAVLRGFPHLAWHLVNAMHGFYWLRRYAAEWITTTRMALAAAETAGDRAGQAATRLSLADAYWTTGRHDDATVEYEKALRFAEQIGWDDGWAAATGNLASVYVELGDLGRAQEHYLEALERFRTTGRSVSEAAVLNNLGNVYWECGDLPRSARYFSQALERLRRFGAPAGEASVLLNLGVTHHDQGGLADAGHLLRAGLLLCQQTGNRADEAICRYAIAAVCRDAGKLREALRHAEMALELADEISVRRIEVGILNVLGTIHLRAGRYRDATHHHQRALRGSSETRDLRGTTEALIGLARSSLVRGRPAMALCQLDQALEHSLEAGYWLLYGRALMVRAEIGYVQHRHDEALVAADLALPIHRRAGSRLDEAWTALVRGLALRQRGDTSEGRRHVDGAVAALAELGAASPDAWLTILTDARSRTNTDRNIGVSRRFKSGHQKIQEQPREQAKAAAAGHVNHVRFPIEPTLAQHSDRRHELPPFG